MSQANGVPVSTSPRPPMPMATPDIAAKRCAGKLLAMKSVHTTKAGEQPMPIKAWPSTRTA